MRKSFDERDEPHFTGDSTRFTSAHNLLKRDDRTTTIYWGIRASEIDLRRVVWRRLSST